MFFEKVLSYKGAWDIINDKFEKELVDINEALPVFIHEFIKQKKASPKKRRTSRDIWESLLIENGWSTIDKEVYSDTGKRIRIDSLGPVKKELCASIPLSYLEFFNRWFFVHSIVAAKYGIIGIPILLIPTSKYTGIIDDKWLKRTSFETIQNQLMALSPMNHPIPFLIIGFTEQLNIQGTEVLEIEADPLSKPNNRIYEWTTKKGVSKNYHQIGFDILSFFSTYLREQYPNEDADITVKQVGQRIKIIVESQNTKPHIIEKAFGEYYSIISRNKRPEEYVKNENLIIQLETQIEILKLKADMLNKINNSNENRIEKLLDIIEKNSKNKPEVFIDITNKNINKNKIEDSNVNRQIEVLIDSVNEIVELTEKTSGEYLKLNELVQSLESISKEKDKEVIKNSSAMKKTKNLVEIVEDKTNKIGKLINTCERGWSIMKRIVSAYNTIAKLCGIDIIPWDF